MVREVEGCTVNKKVSSIPLRGHSGGLIGSACVLVPGCHANPLGLFYPRPRARQTDGRKGRRNGRTNGRTRGRMDRREVFQESMAWGGGERVMDTAQRKVNI